jgi:hypothetical protein
VTRVLVVLAAVFLVNLPVAHQTLIDRQISSSGRDVEATLLASRTIDGDHLVEYRLPRSVDPLRKHYSARVDTTTYQRARESRVLLVRVVPGKPSANRPAGEVDNSLFSVVAVSADVVLLVVGVLLWRRWRRSSLHEVVALADDEVTLVSRGHTLTAATPPGWTARVQPGERVAGSLHLVVEGEVQPGPQPGPQPSGLEQLHGSTYVVRGRVLDARTGRMQLELDDGFRLSVETGSHRIRADIRDSTEVRGNLCFTPSGFRTTEKG